MTAPERIAAGDETQPFDIEDALYRLRRHWLDFVDAPSKDAARLLDCGLSQEAQVCAQFNSLRSELASLRELLEVPA